jgi:hypothetical protein
MPRTAEQQRAYRDRKRGGSPKGKESPTEVIARFWSRVDRENGPVYPTVGTACWVWTAQRDKQGYGRIKVGGRRWTATHISWRLSYGQVPKGKMVDGDRKSVLVCHKCDNPSCVRPDHLFLGTNQENQVDCVRKGRDKNRSTRISTMSKLSNAVIKLARTHFPELLPARWRLTAHTASVDHVVLDVELKSK